MEELLLLPNRLGAGLEEDDVVVVVVGLLAIKENVGFGAEVESVGGVQIFDYDVQCCSERRNTHVLHMNTIFGYSEREAKLFSALNVLMGLKPVANI